MLVSYTYQPFLATNIPLILSQVVGTPFLVSRQPQVSCPSAGVGVVLELAFVGFLYNFCTVAKKISN